jgi:hypothetical protein
VPITRQQAERLNLPARSRWSPFLKQCALLLSANESYQRAEEDLATLTGVTVSHSTLQRLVQRESWEWPALAGELTEMSLDGGMIRVRTPVGQPSEWREYKALQVGDQLSLACFKDNAQLIDWVGQQPWAETVTGLGDGHDGVWVIYHAMGRDEQRVEVLDGYHLMENLAKVSGTPAQLEAVKALLWQGQVGAARQYLYQHRVCHSEGFRAYLKKHQGRIPNYEARQQAGESIGSGRVESLVKQLAARVKLSGAQWSTQNVPQVLRLRCAYLNGAFAA